MKKASILLFVIFASLASINAFGQQQPSKEKLVGKWVHPMYVGGIEINGKTTPIYNNEIFVFKSDGTFVFGEYDGAKPLFEVEGSWVLSKDKKKIVLIYDDGETSSIDIRQFDGKSFVTTSMQGNDFKFTKAY